MTISERAKQNLRDAREHLNNVLNHDQFGDFELDTIPAPPMDWDNEHDTEPAPALDEPIDYSLWYYEPTGGEQ